MPGGLATIRSARIVARPPGLRCCSLVDVSTLTHPFSGRLLPSLAASRCASVEIGADGREQPRLTAGRCEAGRCAAHEPHEPSLLAKANVSQPGDTCGGS